LAHKEPVGSSWTFSPTGDLMFDAGALWVASYYELPLLVVMFNNRAYYNDWEHQERLARQRELRSSECTSGWRSTTRRPTSRPLPVRSPGTPRGRLPTPPTSRRRFSAPASMCSPRANSLWSTSCANQSSSRKGHAPKSRNGVTGGAEPLTFVLEGRRQSFERACQSPEVVGETRRETTMSSAIPDRLRSRCAGRSRFCRAETAVSLAARRVRRKRRARRALQENATHGCGVHWLSRRGFPPR